MVSAARLRCLLDAKTDSRCRGQAPRRGDIAVVPYAGARRADQAAPAKVCGEAGSGLMPPAGHLDFLVLGAEWFTLNGLVQQ